MSRRIVAIQANDANENTVKLINDINTYQIDCSLIVFKNRQSNLNIGENIEVVDFPDDVSTISKMKNFIIKYCTNKQSDGFLHMIEHNVLLLKNPIEYINNIENTMDVFDYDIHFSTVTDGCNYLFNKFNPRVTLDIDDIEIKQKLNLPDRISFTSHSNTAWIIFNLNNLKTDVQLFDERFSIAMFAIIEYLARRKATRKPKQMYLMNQYLSISDEYQTFKYDDAEKQPAIDQKKMDEENEIFKSMKVDYSPDNNIDMVLDLFYEKLTEKINSKNV